MPRWDPNAPSNPKYQTKEHRTRRAALKEQLRRQGYLVCTADVCVFTSRTITNPNGLEPDGMHLGHEDDGVGYRGPQHAACNIKDGATRASQRSHGDIPRWPT